ncbi:hypothetical protein ACSCBZ_46865 [Streptomyces niveiscabiei]|uniref:hypothetical protein n=1 Tax=Streptomyces niveiscabiei TaxID=164115 RepID=UPI0006EB32DD|nr:hypothetical protein [Streptomyces niveiscabiei]
MSILGTIEVLMPVAAVIAAVLLRRIATTDTNSGAVPAGHNQPECAQCGATEINWVAAVCVPRWARVQGRLLCPACLRGFPEWMHSRI